MIQFKSWARADLEHFRYHFVREFVEDKFIKIIFVHTDENVSDGFTKNVSGDIYDKPCKEFIAEWERYFQGG
jgi:hypothetical protein